MTNVSVVTFDVADGSFTFYSKESWETTIEEWRKELAAVVPFEPEDDRCDGLLRSSRSAVWGEEVFVDFITPGVNKIILDRLPKRTYNTFINLKNKSIFREKKL